MSLEQTFLNGLMLGFLYCLIALGITLIFSILGILNFAHGQMYVLGGFTIYYFYGKFHFNFFISLILSALILATIGLAFYYLFFRRVLRIARAEESSMLLAMGTALLIEETSLLAFGEQNRGVPPVIEGVYRLFGMYLVAERLFVMITALVLIVGLVLFVKNTKFGMAMRALAQDKVGSYLQGVDIHKISGLGFALGAGLAGVAGGLLAPTLMIVPGIGGSITIKSFIVMMLGGFGSVPGAILGGFLLGFMEAFGSAFLPGSISYLCIFCAMITLLIFRPRGIMGKPSG
jgi:branched-chain amino acid transport system permease protein